MCVQGVNVWGRLFQTDSESLHEAAIRHHCIGTGYDKLLKAGRVHSGADCLMPTGVFNMTGKVDEFTPLLWVDPNEVNTKAHGQSVIVCVCV